MDMPVLTTPRVPIRPLTPADLDAVLAVTGEADRAAAVTAEVGLYYALAPAARGRGYATEAGGALLGYGFEVLRLGRIVATTTRENLASQGVMRRLGMRLLENPWPEPPWLQIVGVRDNPGA